MSQEGMKSNLQTVVEDLQDLSLDHATVNGADRSTTTTLDRPKVAEESFDKATASAMTVTSDDVELQNQTKTILATRRKSKEAEKMPQLNWSVSGSGNDQDIINNSLLGTQQKTVSLCPEYEDDHLLELMPEFYKPLQILLSFDQFEEAESLCKEFGNEKRTQNDDLDSANYFEICSIFYRTVHLYSQAISGLSKALVIRKTNEESDLIVAITVNNLAICHAKNGNFVEALELCRKALLMKLILFESKHPSVAKQLYNFGILHQMRDDYSFAAPYYEKSFKIYKELLGPEASATEKVRMNLTSCYLEQGKVKEAEALQNPDDEELQNQYQQTVTLEEEEEEEDDEEEDDFEEEESEE